MGYVLPVVELYDTTSLCLIEFEPREVVSVPGVSRPTTNRAVWERCVGLEGVLLGGVSQRHPGTQVLLRLSAKNYFISFLVTPFV